jgi:hypothetical protein
LGPGSANAESASTEYTIQRKASILVSCNYFRHGGAQAQCRAAESARLPLYDRRRQQCARRFNDQRCTSPLILNPRSMRAAEGWSEKEEEDKMGVCRFLPTDQTRLRSLEIDIRDFYVSVRQSWLVTATDWSKCWSRCGLLGSFLATTADARVRIQIMRRVGETF